MQHQEARGQQQQQQQQQQQSYTSFTDVCSQGCPVRHIARHLGLRDAAALACSTKHAAAALRGCLFGNNQLALCPRIIIAASGSSKLLELPLSHDGSIYQCSSTLGTNNTAAGAAPAAAAAAAAAPEVAATAAGAAAVIREVPAEQRSRGPGKRKLRPRLTLPKGNSNMWLTGLAVGPHHDPAAAAAAAAAGDVGPDKTLYVCDYSTRGVRKYCPVSLRQLGVFASAPELKCPEGITWVGSACYVTSAANCSIVRLNCQGRVQQVLDLSQGLMPCVVWGMTAWQPHGSRSSSTAGAAADTSNAAVSSPCDTAAAAAGTACQSKGPAAAESCGGAGPPPDAAVAAAAALFLAADVEYIAARYEVPPEEATGGVLCVALSSSGAMLEPPTVFSKLPIKRPSGLSFDHEGHLWVTSLDGLLLRLAGPAAAKQAQGSLLQVLTLQQLLPGPAGGYLPFDVLAMPLQPATAAEAVPGSDIAGLLPLCAGAVAGATSGSSMVRCGGTQLVVTLHRGAQRPGAVAVLRFSSDQAQQSRDQGSSGGAVDSAVQHAGDKQQQVSVSLVTLVNGNTALREPNMVALI
uniref:SMP-30/Gluconolactonase/LRE-like region domain-containing protein n=1 Tax=Tetradesmus obliquus TaxID=3088 RepID=A0A383WNG1_TETOB|eukprot:jgi/Sobl393_1/13822/SZX78941.1